MARACARHIDQLFDADRIAANFSAMDQMFPTRDMGRDPMHPSPMAIGPAIDLPLAAQHWITRQNVTSFLVLKGGQLVHESYHLGTGAQDRRMSWSIAKSFLSALLGILQDEGAIPDLETDVAQLAPSLAQSAYAGVSLRQLLQMTSGVVFDEAYLEPTSDIRQMARLLGRGGSLDGYAATRMQRHAPPGQVWAYSSVDTHVLGMAIRGATGQDIAGLMQSRLLDPLRCEAPPCYVTDAHGTAFVLGGLCLRSRDYARFGLMMADGGHWQGQQVVPEAWVAQCASASAPTPAGEMGYGLQWWHPADGQAGEFMACGIYGQSIYINQPRQTVCVTTSANRQFSDPGVFEEGLDVFRSMAAA